MNKKRLTILALITAVIMLLSVMLFAACNPDDDDDKDDTAIEATEGLLISNSDFKVIGQTTDTYPRSITSWTGAKMYSSKTYPDDVIAGAINIEQALYAANMSSWNDKGGKVKGDKTLYDLLKDRYSSDKDAINNLLMIYMPEAGTDLGVSNAEYGPTAYGYTSTSFSLEKNSYYKLSLDVLTYDIKGVYNEDGELQNDPGARIYLSSNAYAEFDSIDTNGEWQTYEIYIESSTLSSTSLSLQLALGKYTSSYTKGLTTGYAFFDNVTLEKIVDEADKDEDEASQIVVQGKTPAQVYDDALSAELDNNSYIQTVTLKVPNGRFDFGSTTISSSSTPSNWTLAKGNSGESDPAPTSIGWNGIIDTTKFASNMSGYGKTYYVGTGSSNTNTTVTSTEFNESFINAINDYTGRVGSNVYMLSQQLMTAQGIKSSKTITFEKGKVYKLSVSILTYDIHGAGVSLVLSGSDGADIVIEGISQSKDNGVYIGGKNISDNSQGLGRSNERWTTYSFYVLGNQFKDYSYYLTLWLGTEGTKSNTAATYQSFSQNGSTSSTSTTYTANGTFSSGWVFFDDLKLADISDEEITTEHWNKGAGQGEEFKAVFADGTTTDAKISLQTDELFEKDTNISANFGTNYPHQTTIDDRTDGFPSGWDSDYQSKLDKDNTLARIPTGMNVGTVSLATGNDFSQFGISHPETPYDIAVKNALMLQSAQNGFYEISTEEFDVKANNFYRISLWVKTVDVKSTSGIYVYLMNGEDELASFTKINTADYSDYTNDWCELTFMVRGATKDVTSLHLKVTFGTGDRFANATLGNGAMFVTNMSMTAISYENFTNTTTGTYVKSANLSTSFNSTFTNGGFNNYDLTDEKLDDNGMFENTAGIPSDWSINDLTDEEEADTNLVTGIVSMKNADPNNNGKVDADEEFLFTPSAQINTLFGSSASLFDNLYGDPENEDYLTANMRRFGAPNLLALAGLNNNKYSAGYASSSFTLSASTTYKLSVWMKTLTSSTSASIFLTGEASGTLDNSADYEQYIYVSNTLQDWTEYTFYIEVGLNSISLKLNLWLGYDADVISRFDDEEENAAAAKSAGIALFDNVALTTIDSEVFEDGASSDTARKLSFMTDGFDSISSTVESRSELSAPSGWTGSVDTNQDSDDVKSGVVYADDRFLELNDDGFVTLFGADLELDDIDMPTNDEIIAALNAGSVFLNPDSEFYRAEFAAYNAETILAEDETNTANRNNVISAIRNKELTEKKRAQWMPLSELVPQSGKRMLVINNIADSAYYYYSSTMTLTSESYYRISVWVRTYNVNEDSGAYVEFYLGSADESDNPLIFNAIRTDEWTRYEFYVATLDDNVTSAKLKLYLGKYSDDEDSVNKLSSGYAMFDEVEIKKITEAEFDSAAESTSPTVKARTVIASSESGKTDSEGKTETPSTSFNLEYLWWMIPSIVLAIAVIAVVVVFAVRKIKLPKKTVVLPSDSDTQSQQIIDEKRRNYDNFKE